MIRHKRNPHSNFYKIVILAAFTAIFAGLSILFVFKKPVYSPQPTSSELLQQFEQNLGITEELQDYIYLDWINENKTLSPLNGKLFYISSFYTKDMNDFKILNQENLQGTTFENLEFLKEENDLFFAQRGFKKNTLNTRLTGEPPGRTEWIAYEKDSLKCVTRLNEFTDPYASIFCGTLDISQEKLQQPFLSLFDYSYKPNTTSSFRVNKLEDNFAAGTETQEYTGNAWIAKKTNDAWTIVWTGQEAPSCNEMKRLEIPQSIYGDCYTPN